MATRAVRLLMVCAVGAVIFPSSLLATDILTKIPADALFCAKVNNLEAAAGDLDKFLVGLAPVPPLVPMLKGQLGKELGDPNVSALDTAGSWGVYGMVKDKDSEPEIFILMPIKDLKALMAAKGVTKADPNGVCQIGDDETAMLVSGDYAIVCPSEQYGSLAAMAKAKGVKTMAEVAGAAEKALAAKATLWARLDMAKINSLYGQEMAEEFENMKKAPNMMTGGEGASKTVGVYFDALLGLMKQTQTLNLTLTPKADSVGMSMVVIAADGSEMAKTLSMGPTPKGSPELTAYLHDGAMVNYYARVNKALGKKLYVSVLDLFTGNGIPTQDAEKVKGLVAKGFDALGDTVAGTIKGVPGGKPPFALDYVVQVKDAKALDEVSKEAREMLNTGPLNDLYKNMGLKLAMTSKGQAAYNGFDIETTSITIKAVDPNSQEASMIASIYGNGFTTANAKGPGIAFVSVAADSDAAVKKLVDEYKAGGPKEGNSEFKAAMALVPDAASADIIATYNYLRIFRSFSNLIPVPGVGEALAKLPESKSNLVLAMRAGNGTLTMDWVLPKQHAQEIMGAVQQVQVQMMQQRQSGGNGMKSRSMPD